METQHKKYSLKIIVSYFALFTCIFFKLIFFTFFIYLLFYNKNKMKAMIKDLITQMI